MGVEALPALILEGAEHPQGELPALPRIPTAADGNSYCLWCSCRRGHAATRPAASLPPHSELGGTFLARMLDEAPGGATSRGV